MPCTQALLDVYTIQRELGRLDNLRVGLVGDLANGRTVRSLAYLLSMYSGIKFYFVAPDVVRMQVCQQPHVPSACLCHCDAVTEEHERLPLAWVIAQGFQTFNRHACPIRVICVIAACYGRAQLSLPRLSQPCTM